MGKTIAAAIWDRISFGNPMGGGAAPALRAPPEFEKSKDDLGRADLGDLCQFLQGGLCCA